jgi:hypothetical protein
MIRTLFKRTDPKADFVLAWVSALAHGNYEIRLPKSKILVVVSLKRYAGCRSPWPWTARLTSFMVYDDLSGYLIHNLIIYCLQTPSLRCRRTLTPSALAQVSVNLFVIG